jgi:hypothetical protein
LHTRHSSIEGGCTITHFLNFFLKFFFYKV